MTCMKQVKCAKCDTCNHVFKYGPYGPSSSRSMVSVNGLPSPRWKPRCVSSYKVEVLIPATVPDGQLLAETQESPERKGFAIEVKLQEGENLLNIRAVDRIGNAKTYT